MKAIGINIIIVYFRPNIRDRSPGGGGASEVLPQEKRGGGQKKVLAMLKGGGGAQQVLRLF